MPRILPSGKDTYYFEKGVYVLPRGLWVDYDFGEEKTLCSFGFLTGDKRPRFVPGGMNIELYVKSDSDNDFELLYASFGKEDNIDLKDIPLPPKKARYARLVILGNTNHERDAIRIPQYSYFNACYVGEFVLTDASGENVALNKAICGAQKGYANASDGNPDSFYYDIYGGESFFIPQSGYSYYLEKGAVVKGSFTAEYVENINVFGRGILSLEEVTHNPVTVYAEARVSAFMIEHSRNFSVEGITVVDPPCWMVVLNSSEHPGVRRVNLFGRSTNSDGVHFSASRNAVCDGCFIRTCDDIFVAYHYGDSENLTFQNCTVYCDGGRVLLLGLADRGDIRRVTVRNCDVIHTQNVWNVLFCREFALFCCCSI